VAMFNIKLVQWAYAHAALYQEGNYNGKEAKAALFLLAKDIEIASARVAFS